MDRNAGFVRGNVDFEYEVGEFDEFLPVDERALFVDFVLRLSAHPSPQTQKNSPPYLQILLEEYSAS
jgi:hypothetical protein